MITSASNTQVKNIIQLNQKAKARREQGLFVAEGRKMFGEAPRDWISKVYVTESLTSDSSLMEQISMLPEGKAEIVADNVFRQMCDTKTPQGILTVLRKPVWTIQDILRGDSPLIMILEDLQDPGNAGPFSVQRRALAWMVFFLQKPVWHITNPKVNPCSQGDQYTECPLCMWNMWYPERDAPVSKIRFACSFAG